MRAPASHPAAALLVLATMVWAHATEPPENVMAAVADAERQCRDMDGTPNSDAVLSLDDVNRDGGEDWVADYAKLDCEGGINPMCGPRGCALQIYLWNGAAAWTLAFDETVQGHKFGTRKGKPVLHTTFTGADCDQPNVKRCTITYRLEPDAIVPPR